MCEIHWSDDDDGDDVHICDSRNVDVRIHDGDVDIFTSALQMVPTARPTLASSIPPTCLPMHSECLSGEQTHL